jgi:uncharacterized integral membrane protein
MTPGFATPAAGRTNTMSFTRSGDAPERAGGDEPSLVPPSGSEAPELSSSETPGRGTATESAPGQVPSTRTGTAFKTLIAGAIVLILLLVFILENTRSVKIAYFGAGFRLPLGVALLLAAIGGALLVGITGTARIVQMRRHVRRHRL